MRKLLLTLSLLVIASLALFSMCGPSGGSSGSTTTTAGPTTSAPTTTVAGPTASMSTSTTIVTTTTMTQTVTTLTTTSQTTVTTRTTTLTSTSTTNTSQTYTTATTRTTTLTTVTTLTTATATTVTTITTRTTTLTTTSLTSTTQTTTMTTVTSRTSTTSTATTRTTTTRTTTTQTTRTTTTSLYCPESYDDFEDGDILTSKFTLWKQSIFGTTTGNFSNNTTDGANGSSNSLQVNYNLGPTTWTDVYQIEALIAPGNVNRNLSAHNLSVWIKGTAGYKLTIAYKSAANMAAGAYWYHRFTMTGTWTNYILDFSSNSELPNGFATSFAATGTNSNVASTQVTSIVFIQQVDPGGGFNNNSESGSFYVDELEFIPDDCAMVPGFFSTTTTVPTLDTVEYPVFGYIEDEFKCGSTSVDYSKVDYMINAFINPQGPSTLTPSAGFTSRNSGGIVGTTHAAGKLILASLGGATYSGNFATIASTAGNRSTFATTVYNFITANGYDGIDIDWEFPQTTTERANYTLLIQALYNRFTTGPAMANDGKRLRVVFGASPGYHLNAYEWSQLAQYSDYTLFFGYDISGSNENGVGPIESTRTLEMYNNGCGAFCPVIQKSVKGAVDYILSNGYPAHKIIVLMPFYTRHHTSNAHASWCTNGVYNAGSGTYDALAREYQITSGTYTNHWVNRPSDLNNKINAVLRDGIFVGGNNIRGVGFWEWGHQGTRSDLTNQMQLTISALP